jgi:hypothetical protein
MLLAREKRAPRTVGEYKANVLSSRPVALRSCTVSFTAISGIRHSVNVTAESLYEAAALGLAALKKDGWIDKIGPASVLDVEVREPATTHIVSVRQIHSWCDGVAISPDEVLRRKRVKQLLAV